MRTVVAYDISSDKQRRKVAKLLENFLTRVQLSVFEGELPAEVLGRAVRKALRHIDPETDSLRVYRLCGACAPRTDIYGRPVFAGEDEGARVL